MNGKKVYMSVLVAFENNSYAIIMEYSVQLGWTFLLEQIHFYTMRDVVLRKFW